MVEVVVGAVVGLRWWSSVVTGVRSDRHLRCSCPIVACAVDGAAMAAVECKM